MAKSTRGGNTGKPVEQKANVVSLFGTGEGPVLAVDLTDSEMEQAKEIMIEALEKSIKSIRSGEADGIIVINLRSANNDGYGAESYMGGPGVFGNMDRAVGILEMVKFDLIREARKDEG